MKRAERAPRIHRRRSHSEYEGRFQPVAEHSWASMDRVAMASAIEEADDASGRGRGVFQSQWEDGDVESVARQLIQSSHLFHLPIGLAAADEMALPEQRRVVGLFRPANLVVEGQIPAPLVDAHHFDLAPSTTVSVPRVILARVAAIAASATGPTARRAAFSISLDRSVICAAKIQPVSS